MLWLAVLPQFPANATPSWPELAFRLGRYSPRVNLLSAGAGALRLELASSLRLFGGLEPLLERIRDDLAELCPDFIWSVAVTPLAALWIARGQPGTICPDQATTRSVLMKIALSALDLSPEIALRLTSFGLRRLGEVLVLPRASLGARLGQPFVLDLARALGEIEDPQTWFLFPERFDQNLELPAPVEAAPVLMFAARRLIAALSGWLVARNAAVCEIDWIITHGSGQQTILPLRFSRAVYAAPRIERVLKESLERLILAAPALGLRLIAEHSEVRDAQSAVLFDGMPAGGEALAELMDRLIARLGVNGVQGLRCHPDYRPEFASRPALGKTVATPAAKSGTDGETEMALPRHPSRPLWLIDPPEALRDYAGKPQHDGPLRLLSGPERIESGWWDGQEVRRDYFVAVDRHARWLWVFRDPRPGGGWFLQGLFS